MVSNNYHRFFGRVKRLAKETLQDTWFHFRGKTLTKRLVIVVGSSHRVGSTWLYHLLRDITHCRLGSRQIPKEFSKFGTLVLEPGAYHYLRQLRGHVIFKSHSYPPSSEALANSATFVSIYRDPRDVLVSASFYIAHLEEEKGGWGETFRKLPITKRIQLLIKCTEQLDILSELEQWFGTPFAYKVKYKDLKSRPVKELEKIGQLVGLPTTKRAIEKIVLKHSFEVKSGKKPGGSKDFSMRKGIVGDWRNHFDRACIAAFKTQREGRWNRLLLEMGYESSLDWE